MFFVFQNYFNVIKYILLQENQYVERRNCFINGATQEGK